MAAKTIGELRTLAGNTSNFVNFNEAYFFVTPMETAFTETLVTKTDTFNIPEGAIPLGYMDGGDGLKIVDKSSTFDVESLAWGVTKKYPEGRDLSVEITAQEILNKKIQEALSGYPVTIAATSGEAIMKKSGAPYRKGLRGYILLNEDRGAEGIVCRWFAFANLTVEGEPEFEYKNGSLAVQKITFNGLPDADGNRITTGIGGKAFEPLKTSLGYTAA